MSTRSPLHIFLIRHGETDWNRDGKFQGHTDIPLNERGRVQSARLQSLVKAANIQAFWTSDLSRAHETAKLASPYSLPIYTDRNLRECRLGDAEGLTDAEQRRSFGDLFINGWRSLENETDWDLRFPGGESSREVVERVIQIFHTIEGKGFERVAITTHGGVIRRVLKHLRIEPLPYFMISNTLVFKIETEIRGGERVYQLSPSLPIS